MSFFDIISELVSMNPLSGKVNSPKGSVRTFPSIANALRVLDYGQIFSTVGSKRLYVVTKPTWGEKSRQHGDKVAKGFSAGTSFNEIKSYAMRTMKKHGKSNEQK